MPIQVFIRRTLACLVLGCLSLGAAQADDTEIFFNIERDVAEPNILFLLDNSGSMSTEVEVLSSDYDASENYSGDYEDEKIYYSDGSGIYSIRRSVIECTDIFDKLGSIGKTAPYKMAYFYGGSWNSFNNVNVNYSTTRCQADGGGGVQWWRMEARNFYSANYLNWYFNHRVNETKSRLEIVKEVARNLADGLEGVNIGLMAFDKTASDKGEGGVIVQGIRPVADSREEFKASVDSLGADTNTPLAETLFGAKRYFQGGSPFLSKTWNQADNAMEGGQYKSPISLECQANHVVVLTDGQPTRDTNHNGTMASELGIGGCAGNCLDEIADYLNNSDVSTEFDGFQRVITHTIGFQTDQELLSNTATKGGGKYYLANDVDKLEEAFNAIVREVLSTNTTFSSPGVSVNNFNQLNHLDSLYFSVFEPVVEPSWPGNLKKYRLTSTGDIVDQNGNNAIDDSTGFFRSSAQSFWSSEIDGANARKGGVASMIDEDNSLRNVYTYYSGSSSLDLTSVANNVAESNSGNLTKAMFGDADMTDARHAELIRWTRGVDVNDRDKDGSESDSLQFVADPLHSRPYLQIYGGSSGSPDTAIFFGDNQGYLHAVDGETGRLYFSFIPEELLSNQAVLMDNAVTESTRPYGMDGSVVAWFQDFDGDRAVDDSDKVFIYAGMRRGGRSYYGLDVSDRDAPSVLWTIRGGAGDFGELGQSWSDPVKKTVRFDGGVKDVLFFSGGYDPQQDDVGVRTEDSMGRAIYMVDAETGERLWWAGPAGSGADLALSDMSYSIPATPNVIDVNGDGLADQLYVGDMGGQIWRMDFNHGNAAANFSTGGVIASLGGSGAEGNRRFYHTPDLSGTLKNGQRYLNLAIGSGYQAHPLETGTNDRFYKLTLSSIKAPTSGSGEVEYVQLTETDLMDVTDNLIQQGNEGQKEAAETSLAEASGWYIRLTRNGEKVLSASTTLRGDVYFTTFEPSASLDPCVPSAGQSRLFHVELRDGRAVVNYDGIGPDDELTRPDREITLKTLGLPPSPQVITIEGDEVVITGTETLMPPEPTSLVRKIYWYEE